MKKLLTLCFLAFGLIARAQTSGYAVGDIVSDFSLRNIDSKMISMADYKEAKGFIVVFTCNTCPYSNAYEDRINELNKNYQAKGYPVIAINPNDPVSQPGDSFDKMRARAKSKNYSFPYLADPDHKVTRNFGASRTPHVFVLQKTSKGNIVRYIGAIDNDTENTSSNKSEYVQNAVDALLAGNKPGLSFTKAVGCTIKWKKTQG
ncbi:thioredoxin family protein [Daejeonella oryzae]|uniref:thioredoxin family protein n=1 Tax=Daejeonella oryzae TaxID=1122943 RepID=UPI00041B0533|nr:thioredoxin family protein [Daejeonella oryzae]